MNHELVVICSKFIKPPHKIEDAVTSLFSKYKDCVILITTDSKLDVQGQIYGDKELIEIQINSRAQEPLLVLAHELVHAEQILEDKPLSEEEAYAKERKVHDFIKSSLAI